MIHFYVFLAVLRSVLLLYVISWNPRNQNVINKHTQNIVTVSQKAELMFTEVLFYDLFKPKFQNIIHPKKHFCT